jgi:RND family efflux transporter MFP subunit
MKKEITYVLNILFTLLLIAGLYACSDTAGGENSENDNSNEPSVYVKTITIKRVTFTDQIKVLGVAKAVNHANISSDEGGRIKEFIKDKGSYVNKGDVILVIDNDVLKATLDAALAQYERAQNTFTRQKKVYEEKVISEIVYLNSKYDYDAAKANYELIKARYDRTFIKAPFAGIVDMKYAEVGETVLPGAPVVSVVSMNQIKIEAGIPENYVNLVHKGSNVKVVFRDLKDESFNSIVSYVGNTITTNNRTFPVEVLLSNRNGLIKPELSAQLFIETKSYDNVFVIPEEVVNETDLGPIVFIEKDGLAVKKNIEILSRSGNTIAVKDGLDTGDKLITVGFQNLIDGEKVTVLQ